MTNESYIPIKNSQLALGWLIVWVMLLAHPHPAAAQGMESVFPEKIYVQLSSKVYTKDQTIWMKAIVTNAADHLPSQRSGILYVDLIGPGEVVIDSKILKLVHGIGTGSFDLRQQYAEGAYLIRAYTRWNENFGADFFFRSYIQVLSTSTEKSPNPIPLIRLLETEDNKRVLNVQFDPLVLDKDHSQKLSVVVSIEDTKDSLLIKPDRENLYELAYEIPGSCNFVGLSLETKNLATHSKTFVLDNTYLDVQFFPESGYLVHGLFSKVGLKALDANGKGAYISGEILTQQGELITQFETNELGMGYFLLPQADSTLTYLARLHSPVEKVIPLPAVVRKGNVLSVVKDGQDIRIKATSNYLKQDSVIFRIACRGQDYFEVKGQLKDGQLLFALPAHSLPEGVIACTMTDAVRQPLAERLFFHERPESRLNIEILPDKDLYQQREQTQVEIQTRNAQQLPVPAHLSVHVLNQDQLGQISDSRDHILSYFLLSSDLKGTIQQPSFYFQEGMSRHQDLDALMLTQGWRRYLHKQSVVPMLLPAESSLNISGRVKGVFLQRKKQEVQMTLVTMGETQSFQAQTLDSLGAFQFPLEDEYGDHLKILLQTADKAGKNKRYTIELDKAESPEIWYEQAQSIVVIDRTIQDLVQQNLMRKKIKDAFRMSDEGITLEEVIIEGYQMSPQRKRAADEFGKPRVVINGKDIQAKEEKWSSGLFSVLQYHYPNKIRIVQQGNDRYARVIGAPSMEPGDGVTLVAVDGLLVREEDYGLIPYIPPSEVKSVEIIQSARNFASHYMEVVPGTPALAAPSLGSVLAIYTHAGKGLHAVQKPVGLLHAVVPVFTAKKEFYAPAYPDSSAYNWAKPDLRALVHWDPDLVSDSSGKATTTFFNADNLGEMRIIVEAISPNGEIGYQELSFTVEKYRE